MQLSHMTPARFQCEANHIAPKNGRPRLARPEAAIPLRRHGQPLRRAAIYSARSGDAVAVNCRNKPRCRKRLTLREGGLIMQFA